MKKFGRPLILIFVISISLAACQIEYVSPSQEPDPTSVPPANGVDEPAEEAIEPAPTTDAATDVEPVDQSDSVESEPEPAEKEPVDEESPASDVEETVEEEKEDGASFTPPAAPLVSPISQAPTEAMLASAQQLATNLPSERDDVELAKGYLGVTDEMIDASLPQLGIEYQIGDVIEFSVNNFNVNTYDSVNAELLGISEHGYFWFDETDGNGRPTLGEVADAGAEFDKIYNDVSRFFGTEVQPGIDGHLRVHVLNASPLTLCSSNPCGLLGYFSSSDSLPKAVNDNSNQKDMFVMNGSDFGSARYLSVLAHEYRHMIEANYDNNEIDWEVEGSAVLAEDLVRGTGDAINRGNSFLIDPDQQLNKWTDFGSGTHYGQGYMLNRFIYDRIGTDLYREFAQSPLPGLEALTDVAQSAGLPFNGEDIWRDWLVAPAIQDFPVVPDQYPTPKNAVTVLGELISRSSFEIDTTVNQYAADYYQFSPQTAFTLDFQGDSLVPLLDVQPRSGEHMWVARRTNNSVARLTRSLDLTDVQIATLEYDAYRDIEEGYDFGYVVVSADDGVTWQELPSAAMDGLSPLDDPGNNAFTERFFTGRGEQWTHHFSDLTPWAGQEILLRFEFVTDPILNFDGLAIDNLKVPEIGYFDDAEKDTGWVAEGFVRSTGYIPQTWHLQLVYAESDGVTVENIPVDETGRGTIEVRTTDAADGPILIVAATAPVTLNEASYRLGGR